MNFSKDLDRFWSKVDVGPGCWLWTAGTYTNGYGAIMCFGRISQAHIIIDNLVNGPIPPGFERHHECRNPRCVRIGKGHVVRVTKAEHRRLTGAEKTHCPHGHEYTAANTYLRPDGSRFCRECGRIRCRARNARLRATESAA